MLLFETIALVITILFLVIYLRQYSKSSLLICFTAFQVLVVLYAVLDILLQLNKSTTSPMFSFNLTVVLWVCKNVFLIFSEFTFLLFYFILAGSKKIRKKYLFIFILPLLYSISLFTGILNPSYMEFDGQSLNDSITYAIVLFVTCSFIYVFYKRNRHIAKIVGGMLILLYLFQNIISINTSINSTSVLPITLLNKNLDLKSGEYKLTLQVIDGDERLATVTARKDGKSSGIIMYREIILNSGSYALTIPLSVKDDNSVILSVHSGHIKKYRNTVYTKYPSVNLMSLDRTGNYTPKSPELSPVNKVTNGDFISGNYGWNNIEVTDGIGVFTPSYDMLCKNRIPFIMIKEKPYQVSFSLSSKVSQKIGFIIFNDDDNSELTSKTFDVPGDGIMHDYSFNMEIGKDCIAAVGLSVEMQSETNKISIDNVEVDELPVKANIYAAGDNLKVGNNSILNIEEYIDNDMEGVTPSILILAFLFTLILVKYRIFDTIPFSFGKFIENVKIGVIILDSFNKVTYINPSFRRLFNFLPVLELNKSIVDFLEQLYEVIENKNEFETIKQKVLLPNDLLSSIELDIDLNKNKRYQLNIQPIADNDMRFIGKIISFNDISKQKKLQDELAFRNQKLEDYNSTVEDLAVTKERNRIARDIHDSISHELLTIINLLDMCRINFNSDSEKALEELSQAALNTRKCISELRNSIYCLTHTGFESTKSSTKLIESLISNFRKFGTQINLTIDGDFPDNSHIWENIFRICQEALTNSLKHGRAQNIDIIIKAQEKHFKLFIFDDGVGCSDISKGIGLKSMEQRVESIKGTIIYGSGDDGGFNINISIPFP